MTDFSKIQQKIVLIINSVLGGFAGLIGLMLILAVITYLIKISMFADDHVKKLKYLNAIKWVFISFIGILIVWSISGLVIHSIQSSFDNNMAQGEENSANELYKRLNEAFSSGKGSK